jgi:hypothetical protein
VKEHPLPVLVSGDWTQTFPFPINAQSVKRGCPRRRRAVLQSSVRHYIAPFTACAVHLRSHRATSIVDLCFCDVPRFQSTLRLLSRLHEHDVAVAVAVSPRAAQDHAAVVGPFASG